MAKPISFRARTALTLVAAAVLVAVSVATAAARVAPVNTVSPTISGKPRVGQTLSATQGEWQGSPTTFFYQWFRCDQSGASCAAIDAATQPTYALAVADVGNRIRVEVVAENADGASPAARSAATNSDSDPAPDLDRETAGQRRRPGGPDAERDDRNLDRLARFLRVPVEAVPGRPVHRDPRRYGLHLRALRGGGRHQGPRPGHGLQRRRQGLGPVALDGTVRSSTAGFKLGQPKHDRKRGLARFRVTVPSAGLLTLERTAKVRSEQRRALGAGTVKLTVKPRRGALKRLHRRGKVRVRVKVAFGPDAGAPITRDRRITLKN